jgi:hypothetical protein
MKALRSIARQIPVVLTSGYGATPLEVSPGDRSATGLPDAVLAKPYTAAQLRATLQKVMRERVRA